ncbi:cell shape-determining protein [Streptomyces radicis]|uniref:Cell shape-determining protein n=1 Tax=Streptomyces radicis TaxID=1750517 RepID=A0A3A9X1A3_9ACTN|nr:cell shape-determining protein [Streptomyces radicis]RKN25925.1 cell shape-determining protein [Streptomyces radicis]
MSPSSGPATGGNTAQVRGTGFQGVTAVRFGGQASPDFDVTSSTRISAVVPAGTGTVRVTVTTQRGTSTQNVTYRYVTADLPTLTSVQPTRGPVAGGNAVTLTGTGLGGATAVLFGTVPATSFTVQSGTRIVAVAPPGLPGPVEITVTTADGTTDPGVLYFYAAEPVLTALSPPSGPVAGGTTVTLTGTGLLGTTAVTFGSSPATSFAVVSDTQVTAVAPPRAAGTVPVTVTTPSGTSNGLAYVYVSAPQLTAISPASGPLVGGTVVTLTGSGLTGVTTVLFGAVPAAFTVLSDTHLTAVVPPGPAGPVAVTVVASGGTSPSVTFTRVPPPEI